MSHVIVVGPRGPRRAQAQVGIIWSYDDVKSQYARVASALAQVQSLWNSCGAMPGDRINDQWAAERGAIDAFLSAGPSWFIWNWQEEVDTCTQYLTELEAWRQRFAALPACANAQVPPPIASGDTNAPTGGRFALLALLVALVVFADKRAR